jgi:hypothetical protein
MSDYSKTTNFTAKDSLATGDANKVIKGSEHDTEYSNISTAVGTKSNKVSSATNNNLLTMDANGDLKDSTIATNGSGTITATLTGNVTGNLTGNVTGNVTGDLTGLASTATKLVDTNAADALTVVTTASAANNVRVTNAATGNAASVSVTETNSDLDLTRNGTGEITVDATPIYGMVILDTPVSLATDTSTTATGNTPVDLSAHGSITGTAVKAILNVYVDQLSGGSTGASEIVVGEGGETLTTFVHRAVYANAPTITSNDSNSNQITVNLASGEIFDYAILQTGTAPTSRTVRIYLAGYYV